MKSKNFIKTLIFIFIINLISINIVFADTLPFSDVSENSWYYNDVKTAYENNLINGMTSTTFEPDSNITYAQTVKLAACIHQKYTMGFVSLTNSYVNWWDGYVYYAKMFNIISKDYDWNAPATRAEYIDIFSRALPDNALNIKNNIIDNSIPDVSIYHPYTGSIYKMYRAGIVTGMDERGTFYPESNIRRSEVAAILTRMMNENARKSFTLGFYYYQPIFINEPITYIVSFDSMGGTPTLEQKVRMGEKAVWPSDPKREGFSFMGWYTDNTLNKAYNFDNPVTNNITLYAKWKPKYPYYYPYN